MSKNSAKRAICTSIELLLILSMSLSQTGGLKAGLGDDLYTTMEVILCTFIKMILLHPKAKATVETYLMLMLMLAENELNFINFQRLCIALRVNLF